jgi:hypothetical protein
MKKLLELATTMQSASLLGDNMNFYNKKKKKSNDFVKQGVKNIFGVSLIKAQADIIGGMK